LRPITQQFHICSRNPCQKYMREWACFPIWHPRKRR
jgi:hypothetical protein